MNKAIRSYISAWRDMGKYRYIILFYYLVNLVVTFIAASPFTNYFKSVLEYTDILDEFEGYDLMAFIEFLNNYKLGLATMGTQLVIFISIWFVISVFINSGILYAVISKNRIINIVAFIGGGINYFWRIFRLSIYYMLSIAVSVLVIGFLLIKSGINIFEISSEQQLVQKLIISAFIILLLISFFSMIKQYAKIFIVIEQKPVITLSIIKSGGFVVKKMGPIVLLYLLNSGILILLMYLYFLLKNSVSINSWILIFILGQLLLVFKIFVRIVKMDSEYKLFEGIRNGKNENLIE